MGERAKRQVRGDIQDYLPVLVPNALKVIEGKQGAARKGGNEMDREGSIRTVEGFKAVGIPCVGLHQFGDSIPAATKQLVDLLDRLPNRVNAHRHYGISPSVPAQSDPETLTYYIAVEVSDFTNVPEGVARIHVPTQKCAVVRKERDNTVGDIYADLACYFESARLRKVVGEDSGAYELEVFDESLETYYRRASG